MSISNIYKRQTFIIVGVICLLLIIFVSISYAYFTSVLKSDNELVIKSGDLEISYTGSDVITGNFIPMSNYDGLETDGYTFTINNTGTLTTAFKVEIFTDTSVSGTHVPHQYIMVSLNGEEPKQLSTLTKTTTGGTESGNVYLLGNGKAIRGTVSTNVIRLWLKDDTPTTVVDNKVAFKIKVTNEVFRGNSVGQEPVICKRATTLHTKRCSQTDTDFYCSKTGSIGNGNTITYGNLGTNGTLNTGDAFTCDVNGDGTYDEDTERFYYVSDLYTGGETGNESFNSNYAVLIYYSNVVNSDGVIVPDNTVSIAYNSTDVNNLGPVTAIEYIPSTTQWSNISIDQSRQIKNENGTTTTTNGKITFSGYANKAARFLTTQELNRGCGLAIDAMQTFGSLDTTTCRFLLENTIYSTSDYKLGYWLETPWALYSTNNVWSVKGHNRVVYNSYAVTNSDYGVRPAIEVLKSDIDY